jgi:hypothetical protein
MGLNKEEYSVRFVIIAWDKAHHIFDESTYPGLPRDKNNIPIFPPDQDGNPIVVVDITNRPEVQEGWSFDPQTGNFTAPPQIQFPTPPPIPPLSALEVARQLNDLRVELSLAGALPPPDVQDLHDKFIVGQVSEQAVGKLVQGGVITQDTQSRWQSELEALYLPVGGEKNV